MHLYKLYNYFSIILEFLPLYSPDLNPIKAIFKDLKAQIRKNYTLAAKFKNFNSLLEFAIGQLYKIYIKAHFVKVGYIIS